MVGLAEILPLPPNVFLHLKWLNFATVIKKNEIETVEPQKTKTMSS